MGDVNDRGFGASPSCQLTTSGGPATQVASVRHAAQVAALYQTLCRPYRRGSRPRSRAQATLNRAYERAAR